MNGGKKLIMSLLFQLILKLEENINQLIIITIKVILIKLIIGLMELKKKIVLHVVVMA